MEPRFVITGCGRSGTGYMATLLSAVGVPCGHEMIFNPSNLLGRSSLDWPTTWLGDASWLATPYVANMPNDTLVLHQVRDPLAVVRSFVRIQFFEQSSSYRRFVLMHDPELVYGNSIERSMRYWVAWNRMAEKAAALEHLRYRRYRLEDLDLGVLKELIADIGRPADEALERVFASHPRDYNSRGSKEKDLDVSWATLPRGPLFDELFELACRYGYAPAEDGALAGRS